MGSVYVFVSMASVEFWFWFVFMFEPVLHCSVVLCSVLLFFFALPLSGDQNYSVSHKSHTNETNSAPLIWHLIFAKANSDSTMAKLKFVFRTCRKLTQTGKRII